MIVAGTRFGSYEVLEAIGSGGMGEVYRAHDPRMARDVAIKVLPRTVADDPERLRRFEQEARSAGMLNHNNLLTIYELGEHDGAPYMVTELLDGETLRDRLESGPIPPRKAVDFAIQIGRGLSAAHDKGIVHRDLKPENLFLTRDGRVKILDFGLAKLTEPGEEGTEAKTAQRITNPGMVLGTVGYMSPEQVRGKPVDSRSDLFSLGTVLYEMLTGARAFQRDTSAETMTAILREEPAEISVTRSHLSPSLDRIVRHCLEKNPDERFQTARDLIFDLESLSSPSTSSPHLEATESRRFPRAAMAAGGLVLTLLLLGGAFLAGRRTRKVEPVARASMTFSQVTYLEGVESFPALSPDGKSMAFVTRMAGNDDIYVQRTDGRNAINLTADNPGEDTQPSFSPDGNTIAFCSGRAGGGIFLMGATGESIRRLTDFGSSPSWSPDGKNIVFDTEQISTPFVRQGEAQIWSVEVATGKTKLLFKGDGVQPRMSPHLKRIAYWGLARGAGQRDIWTMSLSGSAERPGLVQVTDDSPVDWNPFWSADGKWLFFASDREGSMNLWRVPIDEESGKVLGAPERSMLPAAWAGYFSSSPDGGRIVFSSFSQRSSIEEVDLGAGGKGAPPRVVIGGSLLPTSIAVSPDGKWLAFTAAAPQEDLYVIGTDGKGLRQLTNDSAKDRGPQWTVDGSQILTYSNRGGRYEIWSIRFDGSGLHPVTSSDGLSILLPVPSPEGKRVYVDHSSLESFDLSASPSRPAPLPVGGLPAKTHFRATSATSTMLVGEIWPDHGSVPVPGIVLVPLDTPVARRLSDAGGSAHFLPGGRTIAYLLDGRIAAYDLDTRQTRLLVDASPTTFWDVDNSSDKQFGNPTNYAVSADGHLYMIHNHNEADVWLATIADH
jgi:serine/threonine protein kinase/Tol biopolymer transport system component